MFGPLLRGTRVTLRPARENDAESFVRWFADTEVTRFLARRMAIALEQEQEFLRKIGESKDDVWWVIEADGTPIGATGIHAINWLDANATTGIVIGDKASWGKGYATEAMQLRTRYAFRELNLHKLLTEVDTENEASRKALERSGYRTVGIRHEQSFRDGKWRDRWLGEVLRDDWEKSGA
jgi:ribosomal-protein-alanine N-acetyltransferase